VAKGRAAGRPPDIDAGEYFAFASELYLTEHRSWSEHRPAPVAVDLADTGETLKSFPTASVDAVITSPPYPGMVSYHRLQRLTLTWLGLDAEALGRAEIGEETGRSRRSDYLRRMQPVVNGLRRVLVPGGFAALVVGARRRDAAVLRGLEKQLDDTGLELVASVRRPLAIQRSVGAIRFPERILILRNSPRPTDAVPRNGRPV
jgi:hypothetical protein